MRVCVPVLCVDLLACARLGVRFLFTACTHVRVSAPMLTRTPAVSSRKFIAAHFPVLKYHNMHVDFSIDKQAEPCKASLAVERGTDYSLWW